jgi:hypothetical protein
VIPATADEKQVYHILALIVRDFRGDDLRLRLRAARQTGALLAYVRRAERGQSRAAPGGLGKPVLLSMTRALLASDAELVRGEMLAALHGVPLDERTIGLMAANISDPSPLVRARLIEVLAAQRTSGYEKLLEVFGRDGHELVRAMAAAVGPQRPRR